LRTRQTSGRLDSFKTVQRYIIHNVVIPELLRGRLEFDGWEDAERLVYTNYDSQDKSDQAKAKRKDWGETCRKHGWAKMNSGETAMDDDKAIELLQRAAEQPERHTTQHAPRGRPAPSMKSRYVLNWGTRAYANCQGKTMEEIGTINLGLLKWLYGNHSSGRPSFDWRQFATSKHLVDAIAMAMALDDMAKDNRMFGSFTCAWVNGPPECLGPVAEREDEIDEDENEGGADSGAEKRLPPEQKEEWSKILRGVPNEYSASIADYDTWAEITITPRDRLSEYSRAASTGEDTSFKLAARSLKLRKLHVIDFARRFGFECPCAFHGWGCKTKWRRWCQTVRRIGGVDEDEVSAASVYVSRASVWLALAGWLAAV
jgi:hypothetical protein